MKTTIVFIAGMFAGELLRQIALRLKARSASVIVQPVAKPKWSATETLGPAGKPYNKTP